MKIHDLIAVLSSLNSGADCDIDSITFTVNFSGNPRAGNTQDIPAPKPAPKPVVIPVPQEMNEECF